MIVVAALIPLGLNVTLSGAATQRATHNDVVIVTQPTTVTVTHTLDQGIRTESITAVVLPPRNPVQILPIEYCIPKSGIEVCGSIDYREYVTSVLT